MFREKNVDPNKTIQECDTALNCLEEIKTLLPFYNEEVKSITERKISETKKKENFRLWQLKLRDLVKQKTEDFIQSLTTGVEFKPGHFD